MSPRALLLTGIGILVLGLLLLVAIDMDAAIDPDPAIDTAPASASARAALVQAYLSNACVLIGTSLVVLSAVLSALSPRKPAAPSPAIDHYS